MLLRREAVRALAGVKRRLLHPVPDRLGRGLKFAPELLGRSAMPDQLDHLPPERRRVRPMALRHRGRSLPPPPWGVHATGSTPDLRSANLRRVVRGGVGGGGIREGLITQRSLVQIQPPQPSITRG